MKYLKLRRDAIAPQKAHSTDSGWDVHVIEWEYVPEAKLYKGHTGLSVQPPAGFYYDLVARSSTPLKGWRLANGFGVLDAQYTGPVILLLEPRFSILNDHNLLPPKDRLYVPFKAGQLILRPLISEEVEEVTSFEETERGSSGFGSSGS